MNYENAKPLLRITNLKQHFPLKGGLTVKANDGVTLDIYEGEVFGLVGESGCGKSTLGRTHSPALSPDRRQNHVLWQQPAGHGAEVCV